MALENVYEPREDSYFLAKFVKNLAKGKVLDMGCGGGIQSEAAAIRKKVKSVLAVDINLHALKFVDNISRKDYPHFKKIKTRKSDLFSVFTPQEKFDTIIFNPPYLPEDSRELEGWIKKAINGGKHGYELTRDFFSKVDNHLADKGIIYLLFSTLTNKEKVDEIIFSNLYDAKTLGTKKLDFETLYVYEIKRSKLLDALKKKGISHLSILDKGHRSFVYKGVYKGQDVAIKVARDKQGINRIKNEVNWLKKLNPKKIGPKLIFSNGNYFVMELIKGKRIFDFLQFAEKTEIRKIAKQMLDKCYTLDLMNVIKEEMHNPHKHIIVLDDCSVKMIDFERCHSNPDPKNVTQFCQFLTSTNFMILLRSKFLLVNPDKVRKLAKVYKSNRNRKNLEKIFKELK